MPRPITAAHHERPVERRAGDRHEHAAHERFQRALTRHEPAAAARGGGVSGVPADDQAPGEGTLGAAGIEALMALLAAGPDAASAGDGGAPATDVSPEGATEGEEGVPVPEPALAPTVRLPEPAATAPDVTSSPGTPPPPPSAIDDGGTTTAADAPASMVLPSTAARASDGIPLADDASLAAKALAEGGTGASPTTGAAPADVLPAAHGQSRAPGAAPAAAPPGATPTLAATGANPPAATRHAANPASASPFAGDDAPFPLEEEAAGLAAPVTDDGTTEAASDAPSGTERDDADGAPPTESEGGITRAPDGEPTALGAGGVDVGGEGSSHPSGGEDQAPKAAPSEVPVADAGLRARFVEARAQVQRQRPGWVEVSVADHPLGTLDVILRMQQDGDLSVTVRAPSDDALATLRQHADQLAAAASGTDGAPIALGFERRDPEGRGAGASWTGTAGDAAEGAPPDAVTTAPSAAAYATDARAAIDIRV